MRQPLRHIEDPLASGLALLIFAALGIVGLLMLALMLTLGF